MTDTILDCLVESVRARAARLDGQEPAAAILWTDPRREWRGLIDLLRDRVPELLVLGEYQPALRAGPAIWLRCIVDGALAEPALPKDRAPIVYLPGVARQQLRAGEDCPDALKPIVELLYRGALWHQPNGADWTVLAFLTSQRTLGLDVARDRGTSDALLRALPEVALTPVAHLMGKRLEADDFDRMLAGDVVRDVLRWMGDPAATRARLGANGWPAFRNRCSDELGFDPETEADVVAGEKLGRAKDAWSAVWERFAEAPGSYGDIAGLLRRSRPVGEMFLARERWPELNDLDELALRTKLAELPAMSHGKACDALAGLEKQHGPRRGWVWARMGMAPLSLLLEPLARLAATVRTSLGGATPEDVGAAYRERGWQADAATWEALAVAPPADEPRVNDVVRHLLEPWLDDAARAFQAALERTPLPARSVVEATDDACIVFVDGLRYDIGQRLAERLEARGCRVEAQHRWAALPTVTATAKPAVTPVARQVVGHALGEDFAPLLDDTGKTANAAALRAAMQARGYQILDAGAVEPPLTHPARGWIEVGEIDALGHKLQARLARQIDDELARLVERLVGLLDAGWKRLRVVTDHGWLLLPGGLPKVDLPKHLTLGRWARCAVVAGDASPNVTRVPWHWNGSQSFATAPGIACFNKSDEYAHGGLSVQECLTPDLTVERAAESGAAAVIRSVTWRRLRCLIEASARGGPVTADLRLERPSGVSVVAVPKPLEPDGSVSLVLESDDHESAPLVLVLVDASGQILTHQSTRVGEDV